MKHCGMAPGDNKVQKAIFSFKVKVKVTWCHLKGRHKWSMHAKYEVSISYGSKVIAKVKVDNRQDKNNMPPILSIRGPKNQFGDEQEEDILYVLKYGVFGGK